LQLLFMEILKIVRIEDKIKIEFFICNNNEFYFAGIVEILLYIKKGAVSNANLRQHLFLELFVSSCKYIGVFNCIESAVIIPLLENVIKSYKVNSVYL